MGGMYGLSDLQRGNIEGLGPRENGEKVASELGVTMSDHVPLCSSQGAFGQEPFI
jgi:hypothetical protein